MEQTRVLFLLPITYAGFVFGLRAGLVVCLASLVALLPRAILISPAPLDAVLEIGGIMVIGTLANLWFRTRLRERAKTEAALDELASTHRILQHYVQSMRVNERRLTILNSISAMLCGSLELDTLLRKATVMVSELMEVEVTLIYEIDGGTQELRLVGHEGVSDEFARAVDRIPVGEGIYGEVARSGHPVVVDDVANDPRLDTPEFRRMLVRDQLIAPMIHRERVTGLIVVAMRRPRQFSTDDIEMLTAVGNQIAISIESAHLYEKEREAAQRLTLSERNYRGLFENASDAIWTHDLAGNIAAANKASEQLTGYTVDELLKMKANDFLTRESLHKAGEIRRKLFGKEPVEQPYEQHLIRRDGTEATLMLTTSLVIAEGKPVGFQHMARDVTREKWMADNLRYYLQEITTAQEEERKRIARELHDDTAQALYALNRQVDNFIRGSGGLSAEASAFLKELGDQIRRVSQGVRRFAQDLRPSMLDDLGLLATLRWLVSELRERGGLEAELTVRGEVQRLSPYVELMLFRIVQEALRNIEKHAQASKVGVELEFSDNKIGVSVIDDGKGFELSGALADLPRVGRLGFAGMEERARLLGGTMQVESQPGKGTLVRIEAPTQP